MRDPKGNKIECPICRKTDVHYSKGDTFAGFLMGILFNRDALRCYSCQYLFYRRTAAEDETEQTMPLGSRPQSRRKR